MDADFPLTELAFWFDREERSGPENMAVDEWLSEEISRPVLRVYRWQEGWGSLGCFGNYAEARAAVAGLKWVRRLTGGGIVDHRDDWTYTLALPPSEPLARQKGAESYRLIHRALSSVLPADSRLTDDQPETVGGVCFHHPVRYDLVAADGGKIAGAGQRRSRSALLHQGSVAGRLGLAASLERSIRFAKVLAPVFETVEIPVKSAEIHARVAGRYGTEEWLMRR